MWFHTAIDYSEIQLSDEGLLKYMFPASWLLTIQLFPLGEKHYP